MLRRSLTGLFVSSVIVSLASAESIPGGPRKKLTAESAAAQRFAVSAPLLDVAEAAAAAPAPGRDVERVLRQPSRRGRAVETWSESVPPGVEPLPTLDSMPAPLASFDGLSNQDNLYTAGFRVLPADANGDVGPQHYVQFAGQIVRVFDKGGRALTPPFRMSSLFAPLGGACAVRDDGRGLVLYDPLADRWLLSQICSVADPGDHQMIAVSRTSDPLGSYFLYDFRVPNDRIIDSSKLGVWPDAYYMSDIQFGVTTFAGMGVFAFDRARMLAGDPAASFIYFDLPNDDNYLLPADLDGDQPPPPGTPGYFAQLNSQRLGDPVDGIRLYEFRANFSDPARSTFRARAESPLRVTAFDPRNPPGGDIEQPAPGTLLDAVSDRLMFRLAYRNFGTHESMVVTHTVNVGTGTTVSLHQAGVRYYELRRALPVGAFLVHEQGTHAPDADNRWMASAAQDHQGNLAVGYAVSGTSTMPSIRYAGRRVSDPPGGLFQAESPMVAGTGVQLLSFLWGQYSAMSVDPSDDCTFWYTTQYYTAAGQALANNGWSTRIGSFKFPECTPPARGRLEGTVTDSVTGLPVAGATITIGGVPSAATDAAGRYSVRLKPGVHPVRADRPSYHSRSHAGAAVVDGAATSLDFVLFPRAGSQIAKAGGDGQTGIAGAVLPVPPTVIVRDEEGAPVAGVRVTFTAANGGSVVGAVSRETDSSGRASVEWRLGSAEGPQSLSVTGEGALAGAPIVFQASAVVLQASITDFGLDEGHTGEAHGVFLVNLSSPVPPGQSASVRFATANETAAWNGLTFSNTQAMTIPGLGNAAPYPSVINVPSLPAAPRRVSVTLNGFTHGYPSDVDVLLVGPQGQMVVLMSDAGGSAAAAGQTLTFDDAGPAIPSDLPLVSGTYRPTDLAIGASDLWGPPAPQGTPETSLSVFNGVSAVGAWRLFVLDDLDFIAGSIASWSLTFYVGDYVPASGTLTFGPGASSQTIAVTVTPDRESEADETFAVHLFAPVNLVLTDAQGQGTIRDDDTSELPSLGIVGTTLMEGASGTSNAVFQVNLSRASAQTIVVNCGAHEGSASSNSDFVPVSRALEFPPGVTSLTFNVPVNGDLENEANETFFVSLGGASGAEIGSPIAQAEIVNDDAAVLRGAVTDAVTGSALANVSILLTSSTGTTVASAPTKTDGTWELSNMNPGTFRVRTSNGLGYVDEMYDNIPCAPCSIASGTPVLLQPGATTRVDFALSTGGRIAGRVTNAAGAGLSGISVQVLPAAGGLTISSRLTDTGGSYVLSGLPSGTYRVRTSNSQGYIDELYDNIVCIGCSVAAGAPVVVTAGRTTSGIDFSLDVGGRISGTITDAVSGAPLPAIGVQFYTAAGNPVGIVAGTNASGVYTSVGLPPGTYYARNTATGIYLGELYNNLPCPFECPVTTGAPIVVTTGVTTTGIDFALGRGSRISGTVTAPGGVPITGAAVDVYDAAGTYLTTSVAASGSFLTSALPAPASYFLRTRNRGGFADELYDNFPCTSCVVTNGTPVTTSVGVVRTGIDFLLAPLP